MCLALFGGLGRAPPHHWRLRVGWQLRPEMLHGAPFQSFLVVHPLGGLKLVLEQLHGQALWPGGKSMPTRRKTAEEQGQRAANTAHLACFPSNPLYFKTPRRLGADIARKQ